MKKCTKCGVEKPLSEFHKNKNTNDGLQYICKICSLINGKKWDAKNKHKRRDKALNRQYGISLEKFEAIKKTQNNACCICGDSFSIGKFTHLDHCHKTNQIRGILCNHCNRGLGAFKDSIKILKSAQKYLQKYNKKAVKN
jgi:hypothetical protein